MQTQHTDEIRQARDAILNATSFEARRIEVGAGRQVHLVEAGDRRWYSCTAAAPARCSSGRCWSA